MNKKISKRTYLESYLYDIHNEYEINTIQDAIYLKDKLLDLRIQSGGKYTPHFRGEQYYGWDIIPGILRNPKVNSPNDRIALERKAIDKFKELITEQLGDKALRQIFNNTEYGQEWDLLFQAQHAGVKTSLTDWTMKILHALYFAVEKSDKEDIEQSDAQLWCLMIANEMVINHGHNIAESSIIRNDPFNLNEIHLINSSIYVDYLKERVFESRLYIQEGRFIALPNDKCNIPINKLPEVQNLNVRIRIPQSAKEYIRKELDREGINRKFLYVEENLEHQELINMINNNVFR